MEAYGLTEYYNIIAPGSAGALDATLVGAQKKGDPIFGYYWAPTAIMGMFDWYVLEEPPYDEAVWEQITAARTDESLRPLSEACAYETLPVNKGINPQLRDKAPELVDVMDKMELGLDAINKVAAWAGENEVQDWSLAAVYYLENWESTWKTWVTDDAYKKIKEALAQPQ
jgi:glycine betaine/proline transport system substrate-binding protein